MAECQTAFGWGIVATMIFAGLVAIAIYGLMRGLRG